MDVSAFEIIETHNRRGYVIRRNGFPKRYHSHFKRRGAAEMTLRLLEQDKQAIKPYYIKAQKRLTTLEEFESLRVFNKPTKYKNNPRGRVSVI